jgi:hypothetical protein
MFVPGLSCSATRFYNLLRSCRHLAAPRLGRADIERTNMIENVRVLAKGGLPALATARFDENLSNRYLSDQLPAFRT